MWAILRWGVIYKSNYSCRFIDSLQNKQQFQCKCRIGRLSRVDVMMEDVIGILHIYLRSGELVVMLHMPFVRTMKLGSMIIICPL